jgi:hypothetical protein
MKPFIKKMLPGAPKTASKAVSVPKISKSDNAIKQKTVMTKGTNRTKSTVKNKKI